ncbi:MAG: Wzz/FepE/Etk N-terminal domain-containing protein [Syntrophotaleaceae bacterium]
MTEEQEDQSREFARPYEAEDEINLLEYLLVIVKHKKMILKSCAVAFVLACIITLLMPNIYTGTARVLPPSESKGGLSAMLGGMSDLAALAGVSVGGSTGELYVGMLKSRTVADAIIDQFDLMEVYDQEYRVKTYAKLEDHVQIALGKDDGIVTVSVEDKDPERAAAMANAFVEELKKVNVKINLSSAGRERLFLEERLKLVKKDLLAAEERLQNFQKENKAIKIDDQANAIIEAIAQLKGELASKEVQLGVLRSSQTEQNPEVIALKEAVAQIKAQLKKLEQSPGGKGVSEDIFIATSAVPELGIQYARVLRDFKVQETLLELLTQQYEVAKINEAKNTSTIQVLDDAIVPDKKTKPKRSLLVLAATFVVGFGALLAAFVREYSERMPEEDKERWEEIKRAVRLRARGQR